MEIERFPHREPLDEFLQVLEQEAIPYQLSSTAPTFDFSSIGAEAATDVIVSIRRKDYARARAVLERSFLAAPIPPDHHLADADDDDLMEILANEHDWSPFDVAHARRMARERGIDTARIRELTDQRLRLLHEGRQASRSLVVGGFLLGIVGACGFPPIGLGSVGIAWSLLTMKKKTPEGVFPYFDPPSRITGKVMMCFALGATAFGGLSYYLRITG